MDLLLDVDIILDVCVPHPEFEVMALDAISACRANGGKLWIYTGSVQTMVYTLENELGPVYQQNRVDVSRQSLLERAKEILKAFCADKDWLASIAGEGDIFDADDPLAEQQLRALERFAQGSIKLLTREKRVLDAHPDKTISPKQYCQLQSEDKGFDFIDLKTQQESIRPKIEENMHRVLHHGRYIMGPEVQALEARLADYVGVKHCIGVSSGTDALLIAMMALGVGPGDEVITTSFSFIATGEMIALLGAKPVFVDIDPQTYNIDTTKIEAAISAKTKAIMPVSLYGQCADMDAINNIAHKYGLPVIEDGAQSFGATYKSRRSCGLSTIGCTSFFPSKPLGGYGDSGACFTDDDRLAQLMREIRIHGQDRRYHHPRIGINGRMDTFQAAFLLAKLDVFAQEVKCRQVVGQRYTASLTERASDNIIVPCIASDNTSVYAQYTIQVQDREALQAALNKRGIPTAVHYPVPLYRQPAFAELDLLTSNFQQAERISDRVLSLPMHPYLTEAEQDKIVEIIVNHDR